MSTPTSSLQAPEELSRQHTTTLERLFDGILTSVTAAIELSAITIPNPKIRRHKYAYNIELLFENILSSLHNRPHQVQTVANLIVCISQLPPIWAKLVPGAPKHFISDQNTCLWDDDGSDLGRAFTGKWNHLVISRAADDPRKRRAVVDGFVAVNELVATLIMHDEKRFDYHLFMLWTFRDALECPSWIVMEGSREDRLECYVKASAKLAEIAGRKIRYWEHEYDHGPLVGDPGSGGDLWDGKRGFCEERWELWRRRFGLLSGDMSLGADVRACARRACEMMAEIDN